MNQQTISIRKAIPAEHINIGAFLAGVYAQLEGFPHENEQPGYYQTLRQVGTLTKNPETEILIAVSDDEQIKGAVVYYGDMKYYGAGGSATLEQNAGGFRFLAVDPLVRRQGIGNLLIEHCIQTARKTHRSQVIIHASAYMEAAWKIYLHLGFRRSQDLDFMQGVFPVFGFRLPL